MKRNDGRRSHANGYSYRWLSKLLLATLSLSACADMDKYPLYVEHAPDAAPRDGAPTSADALVELMDASIVDAEGTDGDITDARSMDAESDASIDASPHDGASMDANDASLPRDAGDASTVATDAARDAVADAPPDALVTSDGGGATINFCATVSCPPQHSCVNTATDAVCLPCAAASCGAGIAVSPDYGLITTRSGGTDSFVVALSRAPAANVTVSVVSSNVAQGIATPSSLTFTPTNWRDAQTVTVTGVSSLSLIPTDYSIQMESMSSELAYHLRRANVGATNAPANYSVSSTPQAVTRSTSGTLGNAQVDENDTTNSDYAGAPVALSANGRYVAYGSLASNLVASDTNAAWDVFVRDMLADRTTRVSVSTTGTQLAGHSVAASLSRSGRHISFVSADTSLVSPDGNSYVDIFVYDLLNNAVIRASDSSTDVQTDGPSIVPTLSGDGSYVAFSGASNTLTPSVAYRWTIFGHDVVMDTTELLSLSGGTQNIQDVLGQAVSLDARYVAMNWFYQGVFVRDRVANTTLTIDAHATTTTMPPSITPDGRYVVFDSNAAVETLDTNGVSDVYRYDTRTSSLMRVSMVSGGTTQSNGGSFGPAVSDDGRYVVFRSLATNLSIADSNGVADIYMHDCTTRTTTLISATSGGVVGNAASIFGTISGDGSTVAYTTLATNLFTGDTNGVSDIVVRARP